MDNKFKEYIKEIAKNILDEEGLNVTDNSGAAYSTPKAFKKVDEEARFTGNLGGSNKASGRRYIPEETILPGFLRPGNFKVVANGNTIALFISPLARTALEAITRGRTSFEKEERLTTLTRLFKDKMPQMTRGIIKKNIKFSKINKIGDQEWIPVEVEIKAIDQENKDIYIKVPRSAADEPSRLQNPLYEELEKLIDAELLKEGTYNQFKNEVKFRTKSEQLHHAIREVKRKLGEIDRLVEYTSRMKSELSEGEEGLKYWKATEKAVGSIAETITQLSNKIKNLNQ